jgi:hypothetical protein
MRTLLGICLLTGIAFPQHTAQDAVRTDELTHMLIGYAYGHSTAMVTTSAIPLVERNRNDQLAVAIRHMQSVAEEEGCHGIKNADVVIMQPPKLDYEDVDRLGKSLQEMRAICQRDGLYK